MSNFNNIQSFIHHYHTYLYKQVIHRIIAIKINYLNKRRGNANYLLALQRMLVLCMAWRKPVVFLPSCSSKLSMHFSFLCLALGYVLCKIVLGKLHTSFYFAKQVWQVAIPHPQMTIRVIIQFMHILKSPKNVSYQNLNSTNAWIGVHFNHTRTFVFLQNHFMLSSQKDYFTFHYARKDFTLVVHDHPYWKIINT